MLTPRCSSIAAIWSSWETSPISGEMNISERKLYPVYTIEQTSSKGRANVFKLHVLIARRLLEVCSMFASSTS